LSLALDGAKGVTNALIVGSGRGRVAALDGIRAVAVMAVLGFHGGVGWLRGGFLGVDAFFVLSGYLITTLLLQEWQRDRRLDLAEFWARRARRLAPALIVLVAVVGAVSRFVLPTSELDLLRGDALAVLGYAANWRMILRGTDYFARTATPSPLQHAWSLSIEEQFYLLWPLAVLVLLRWPPLRRRPFVGVSAAAMLAALASVVTGWALAASGADSGRLYFGSDTRAVSVLVGCALAAVLVKRSPPTLTLRRWLGVAAFGGAVVTGWMWTHANGTDPRLYQGWLLLAAVAVAVVLTNAVLVPRSVTARVLSLPPLPALGRISYGVYLWHWPLFGWLNAERTGFVGPLLLAVRCLITVAVATISYLGVERPLLYGHRLYGHRWRLRRPRPTLAAAALSLLATAAGTMLLTNPGGPADSSVASPAAVAQTMPIPTLAAAAPPPPADAPTTRHHRRLGSPRSVVVFGDSIAWTLVQYFPTQPEVIIHDHTMMGCGVALGGPYRYFGAVQQPRPECTTWPSMLQQAVSADDPDVVMILVGRWETMDRVHNGAWTHLGDPSFDDYLRGELDRAVGIAAAHGATVMLCTEPYNRRGERPDGGLWPEDQPERVDRWNTLLRQVAAAHPDTVRVVDFGRRLSPEGHFTWRIDGVKVRSDGVHLTPRGVRWLAPWLLAQFTAAAP
jgi:peptidoglycan/LPS O-acetylase OafA/YrhL